MGRLQVLGHVHCSWERGPRFDNVSWNASRPEHVSTNLSEIIRAAKKYCFARVDLTPHYHDPENSFCVPPFEKLWGEIVLTGCENLIYQGVEANVVLVRDARHDTENIGLDFNPDQFQLSISPVIASIHFTRELGWPEYDGVPRPQQDPEWMLEAYLEIMEKFPYVEVLGHPFQYSVGIACETYIPANRHQLGELATAAQKAGVALEVNAGKALRSREKIKWPWMLAPKYAAVLADSGVSIYIGTDIHTPGKLEYLRNLDQVCEWLIRLGVSPDQIIGWEQ
ncbi:MAG: hypothetical protein ACOC4Z_02185 [Patescibacteria group bacterium]